MNPSRDLEKAKRSGVWAARFFLFVIPACYGIQLIAACACRWLPMRSAEAGGVRHEVCRGIPSENWVPFIGVIPMLPGLVGQTFTLRKTEVSTGRTSLEVFDEYGELERKYLFLAR